MQRRKGTAGPPPLMNEIVVLSNVVSRSPDACTFLSAVYPYTPRNMPKKCPTVGGFKHQLVIEIGRFGCAGNGVTGQRDHDAPFHG